MAALLTFDPGHGVSTIAATVARLQDAVRASLARPAGVRPTLVCRWSQDAEGRLGCHWDIAVPLEDPIPPH